MKRTGSECSLIQRHHRSFLLLSYSISYQSVWIIVFTFSWARTLQRFAAPPLTRLCDSNEELNVLVNGSHRNWGNMAFDMDFIRDPSQVTAHFIAYVGVWRVNHACWMEAYNRNCSKRRMKIYIMLIFIAHFCSWLCSDENMNIIETNNWDCAVLCKSKVFGLGKQAHVFM